MTAIEIDDSRFDPMVRKLGLVIGMLEPAGAGKVRFLLDWFNDPIARLRDTPNRRNVLLPLLREQLGGDPIAPGKDQAWSWYPLDRETLPNGAFVVLPEKDDVGSEAVIGSHCARAARPRTAPSIATRTSRSSRRKEGQRLRQQAGQSDVLRHGRAHHAQPSRAEPPPGLRPRPRLLPRRTLARLEGQIAIRMLLERFGTIALQPGAALQWRRGLVLTGVESLPVMVSKGDEVAAQTEHIVPIACCSSRLRRERSGAECAIDEATTRSRSGVGA